MKVFNAVGKELHVSCDDHFDYMFPLCLTAHEYECLQKFCFVQGRCDLDYLNTTIGTLIKLPVDLVDLGCYED